MKVLVTGAAGFIGFHTSKRLLDDGFQVIGLDCLNDYYDVNLKESRLSLLKQYGGFDFVKLDISHEQEVKRFFLENQDIGLIVHLAAQAGVRYSLTHPFAYIDANIRGHLSMLEGARLLPHLQHMVYASSSSVYGSNEKSPFAVEDRTDNPISLYAASKKSCELISECYSHLHSIPLTGLRFFTVYGPWGRPDMSAFIFAKAIIEGNEMPVFNHGRMRRNFTYIDDIVAGTLGCLHNPPKDKDPIHRVYNIGNNKSESLLDFIKTMEDLIGKKANMRLEPMQPGDVPETVADISKTQADFGFAPKTNIAEGLRNFIDWYKHHYQQKAA